MKCVQPTETVSASCQIYQCLPLLPGHKTDAQRSFLTPSARVDENTLRYGRGTCDHFNKSRWASIFSVRGPPPLLPLAAGMRVCERYLCDLKQLVCLTRAVNQTYQSVLSHTHKSHVMQRQRMQVIRRHCAFPTFCERHDWKVGIYQSMSFPHYKADMNKMAVSRNILCFLNLFRPVWTISDAFQIFFQEFCSPIRASPFL